MQDVFSQWQKCGHQTKLQSHFPPYHKNTEKHQTSGTKHRSAPQHAWVSLVSNKDRTTESVLNETKKIKTTSTWLWRTKQPPLRQRNVCSSEASKSPGVSKAGCANLSRAGKQAIQQRGDVFLVYRMCISIV